MISQHLQPGSLNSLNQCAHVFCPAIGCCKLTCMRSKKTLKRVSGRSSPTSASKAVFGFLPFKFQCSKPWEPIILKNTLTLQFFQGRCETRRVHKMLWFSVVQKKFPARSWQKASVSLSPPVWQLQEISLLEKLLQRGMFANRQLLLESGKSCSLTQMGTDQSNFVQVWECRLVIFDCAGEVICC